MLIKKDEPRRLLLLSIFFGARGYLKGFKQPLLPLVVVELPAPIPSQTPLLI